MDEGRNVIKRMREPKREDEGDFMSPQELKRLRVEVMRVTQAALASQLIDPSRGLRVSHEAISLWESGRRKIPLWVARTARVLGKIAQELDARENQKKEVD